MNLFKTQTIEHEVRKGSNLDLLVRGFHGIGNRLVDSLNGIGTGLQAIALALSTPQDNSAEVKELTSQLKQSADVLQSAIDQATKGK